MTSRTKHDDGSTEVDFGLTKVEAREKTQLVEGVFARVAERYDVMNDFMSLGTHRLMKRMVIDMSGVRPGHTVLDLAGGTGDMSALFADAVGPAGRVVLTDYNDAMLAVGRDRLLDRGLAQVDYCRAAAEALPFADETFDCACISFGIRNFTDKDQALRELLRVLKPGAGLIVLEFSKPASAPVQTAYKIFQVLWAPAGQLLVGDGKPYEYLVESIEVHPDQRALKQMFEDAGFVDVSYHDLIGGIAAVHRGKRPVSV